jgi:Xaa-Pro aminopeptidase
MDLERFVRTLFYLGRAGEKTLWVSQRPEEIPAQDSAMTHYAQQQRPWDNRPTRAGALASWYRERFPAATIRSWDSMLDEMRWTKTGSEIEALRKAGHVTALGLNEALKATRPGRYEYQVAAAADFVFQAEGAQRLAFAHIAASGANANTWHYFENDDELTAGDLVLLDTGAEYDYYAADLTRTWPVSGEFTEEQEKLQLAEAHATEIGELAQQHLGRELDTYTGHFVGMSVHDAGPRDKPFEPGVVFNVEPILEKPGIHIRLEDTILVTEDGHENLTRESPNGIEDLYRLYQEGSRLYP